MPKTVLDEDEYLACLSFLLRRDFYPELLRGEQDAHQRARHSLDSFPSIDAFQAAFTCSDDASFEALLEKANATNRSRWLCFFGTETPLALTHREHSRVLALPASALSSQASRDDFIEYQVNRRAARFIPEFHNDHRTVHVPIPAKVHASMLMATPRIIPGHTPTSTHPLATPLLASVRGAAPMLSGTPLMTYGQLASTPRRLLGSTDAVLRTPQRNPRLAATAQRLLATPQRRTRRGTTLATPRQRGEAGPSKHRLPE